MKKRDFQYKYRGCDWSEMAVAFGICPEEGIENADEFVLTGRLRAIFDDATNAISDTASTDNEKRKAHESADSIRRFLRAMAKCRVKDEANLWLGLARCDDYTVLKYAHVLLEYMWT